MKGFKPGNTLEKKMVQGVLFRYGDIPAKDAARPESGNSVSSLELWELGGSVDQTTLHQDPSEQQIGSHLAVSQARKNLKVVPQ